MLIVYDHILFLNDSFNPIQFKKKNFIEFSVVMGKIPKTLDSFQEQSDKSVHSIGVHISCNEVRLNSQYRYLRNV
jgi:hypothetical protein